MPQNINCDLCELCKGVHSVCLWGLGKPDGIALVGQAPGGTEDAAGKPFVGSAGQVLRRAVKEAGLDAYPLYITNVVKCRPPRNRKPTQKEITTCSNAYLVGELADVKPKLIIALGNESCQAVLKREKTKITRLRGRFVHSGFGVVLPTFHPAYVLRDPSEYRYLVQDLKVAKAYMDRDGKLPEIKYEVFEGQEGVDKLCEELTQYAMATISLDLETTGLNPLEEGAAIITWNIHVVGTEKAFVFYPDNIGQSIELAKTIRALVFYIVAQNAKFDLKWILALTGVELRTEYDTQVAAALLDENHAPHSLKRLVGQYAPDLAGYDLALDEFNLENGSQNVPREKLSYYAAGDAVATTRVFLAQSAEIRNRELSSLHKIQCKASDVLKRMEVEGVLVDRKYIEEIKEHKERELADTMSRLPQGFNPDSSKQVAELLFDSLGIKPEKFSRKSDNPSTDAEVLALLAPKYPVAKDIIKCRQLGKLISTYFDNWLEISEKDGRVRTNYKLDWARTGRLSSEDINLQNVPREKDVKKCFIAAPGYVFVESDYSQMELRVLAHLSEDPVLMDAYSKGIDVHTLTACLLFDKKPEEVTKDERYLAKTINFSILYGAQAKKLVETVERDKADGKVQLELSVSKATTIISNWFHIYKGADKWIKATRAEARANGYVRGIFGRARRIYGVHYEKDGYVVEEMLRQAVNAPIQGSASDITLVALGNIGLSRELPQYGRCVLTVHDQILFEIKEDKVEEAVPWIRTSMENAWKLRVPLKVEIKVGPNWGDLKEVA